LHSYLELVVALAMPLFSGNYDFIGAFDESISATRALFNICLVNTGRKALANRICLFVAGTMPLSTTTHNSLIYFTDNIIASWANFGITLIYTIIAESSF